MDSKHKKPIHYGRIPRKLEVVKINGKQYFKDDRLKEYRNVNNPHDVIRFSEVG